MADINKTIIIADTYDFDIEQFRGTPVINLNKLIGFYDELVNLISWKT
jgi:predicted HicB family RNase H-like nuclease